MRSSLGRIVLASGNACGAQSQGFYRTPQELVELMTRMTQGDDDCRRLLPSKVMDPCVGTGRLLVHASNYSLRLYGNDIDLMCVLACKINGCLYAPWLTYPLPDSLFVDIPQTEPIILTYDERPKYQNQAVLFG